MPCTNTIISHALAALFLACLAPCAVSAADAPYGPGGKDDPNDLAGSDVLTAHANLPDPAGGPIDDACRAAARASNGGNDGEIVVCSHGGDGTSERVPASKSVDESTNVGDLRPPDVSGLPGCLGPCITIPFGNVPPPVYYIDLSTIPEAPKGSDAWKIGQGELRAP